MKISIKLGELRNATENAADATTGRVTHLAPLSKLKTASLPMGMMFDLKRLSDRLQPELKRMEEQRVELIKKHGELSKDNDGNEIPEQWQVMPANLAAYFADYNEMLTHSIEIEAKQLSAETLDKYSTKLEAVGFNTEDLMALDWLIVWPKEETSPKPVESIAEHQAKKEQVA